MSALLVRAYKGNQEVGKDYITFYSGSDKSSVVGDNYYTGISFPGMNGNPALGVYGSGIYIHFVSGALNQDDASQYGYEMDIVITRLDSAEAPQKEKVVTQNSLGITNSAFVGVLSMLVSVAACSCLCLRFWYARTKAIKKSARTILPSTVAAISPVS